MLETLSPYKNWVVTFPSDKIPLNPYSGKRADVSNPDTWSDYATANAVVQSNPSLLLGFVLTNAPFVCIDLDTYKTTDPAIIANHKHIYETFHSYGELSPSGGVHIWCQGSIPTGKKFPQQFVEMYCSGRYMTVTGQALNGGKIEQRQSELNELYSLIEKRTNELASAPNDLPETQTDEQVIEAAYNALNGELFRKLYMGEWQATYPSQSEADLAFVSIVAFYTDSKDQVKRIFYASVLGQRKKAHRDNYLFDPRYGIITKAFDQKMPNITFANLESIVKGKVDEEARKALMVPIIELTPEQIEAKKIDKLPTFIKDDYANPFTEPPPGMVGDIARFIYANSVRPVKEISISAAIGYYAGIVGKLFNVSHTGLNHYIAVLAPTAGGKEGAASGMERLTAFVREKFGGIDQFIGPAGIASPQALIKQLATVSPCFISYKGEMGFWFQGLTNKYAKQNETALRGLLLDLYTKSGKGQVIRGSIYSDKTKDIGAITAPCFTLFGDATPGTFYKALDEENIEEGLVSRFTIVECAGEEVEYNEMHSQTEPDALLVNYLAGLCKRAIHSNQTGLVVDIAETPHAHDMHMTFMRECYSKAFAEKDTVEAKLYSRAHLKLLRLAGLLAVGVNPDNPVMDEEVVNWAKRFVVHGIARVALRFEKGEVGQVSYYIEQKHLVKKCIQKYWLRGWKDTYGTQSITREMYDSKVITQRFIQANVMNSQCFRRDRNPTLAFRNIIQELVEGGVLFRIDMAKIKDSNRQGVAYYITDLQAVTNW